MLSVSKPTSLVEQKKQQWAREREEMSHLYLPWGSGDRYADRLKVRNQFASTLELHKQSSYEYPEPSIQRQRSPSLPPIHHIDAEKVLKGEKKTNTLNRNIPSAKRFSFYDEDAEGDTSGYGSETVNHMNRNRSDILHDVNRNPVVAWQQNNNDDRKKGSSESEPRTNETPWSARSPRTAEEGRLRWGDRGVATGRLWEPTAPNARLPQMPNQKRGTPSWVERGLNMIENSSEVLIIDQRSSSNSTGVDCDRSSCNGSDEGRSFLRGQNVPLEPEVKAQRENKRIKALELQTAILNQLEERERQRQEEKDRKLKEEKLEELRLQKQQEQDRYRLEEEKKRHEEKQLMEQRKLEALKKALDDAEKKARIEKEKRFTNLRKAFHINLENENKDNCVVEKTVEVPIQNSEEPTNSPKPSRTYEVQSAKNPKRDCNSHHTSEFNSPRSTGPGNVNLFIHSIPTTLTLAENEFNVVPINMINNCTNLIGTQTNGIQLAVLVPQNLAPNLASSKCNLLKRDAWTQTETSVFRCTSDKYGDLDQLERNIDKDYPKIDENAPQDSHHSTLKKDRRFRSEERYKKDIDSRPKWGVNRPVAQYKKQSEKDPFYSQKRKVRQKYRPQPRQYLSQSSEDSRSPSPPNRSEKNSINNNNRFSLSQSYWRNKKTKECTKSTEPISHLQLEFSHIDQITANEQTENKKSPKMSQTKRLTLSQKFINDKYGNRKLWIEDINERNGNLFDTENRKRIIDQINNAKRDSLERNEDHEEYGVNAKYDLFDKKKDEAPMLDLSKTVINTAEEYRAVLDKVPDFKTRPEKVRAEDIKIRDRLEDQKTKTPRKEIKAYEKLGTRGYEEKHFTFMDPIPVEMRGLKFEELCTVPIEWRMLTSIRPKSKLDEEYFNRLIELGKSELRTKARDKREYAKNTMIRKTKNRSGVTETRIVSCAECGEEYCNGKMCAITNYDMFARLKVEVETKSSRVQAAPAQGAAKLRRLRRRTKRKSRSKSAAPPQRKTQHKSGARSDSEL